MSCPVSVYNNAPEHRAELIDVTENEIKWCSPVPIQSVCLRRPYMTASHQDCGWWGNKDVGSLVHVQVEAPDVD